MDATKKACCKRAIGWSLVGIAIALAWGIGNVTNGMNPLSAFAIPGLIILLIVGIVALSALNTSWFNSLCSCPTPEPRNGRDTGTPGGAVHT